jgi:TRAP-type mannitol/chloroaromatic compound transport system substrate-binding protein
MGFYKVAKHYYYPGWHEPGTVLEMFINKAKFNSLPRDLQVILKTAAYRANVWMLSEFESKNHEHLEKLINEHNVKLTPFPKQVLDTLKQYSEEVINEVINEDALSKKVYTSFSKFKKTMNGWAERSEKMYYNNIA